MNAEKTSTTKILKRSLVAIENKKHVKKIRKTPEQYRMELKEVNPDIEPIEEYIDARTPILHRCKIHNYIYKAYPSNVLRGTKCKICRSNHNSLKFKKTDEQYKKDLYDKNPHVILLDNYTGVRSPAKFLCLLCNNTFSIAPGTLLKKKADGCPKCRENNALSKTRFTIEKYRELARINNPYIEVLGMEYINNSTKIKHRCRVCNNIFYAIPGNILKGHGCRKCADKLLSYKLIKSNEQFINEFNRTNTHSNDILLLSEYTGSHNVLHCKCKICGNIWFPLATNLLKGSGCPSCKSSFGENIINNYLNSQKIIFESQKKFCDLKGINNGFLSYDFYLKKYNLLIECQGMQHEKPVDFFGGKKTFIKQQIHDIRKRRYAKEHNIKLITIWYNQIDKIPEILNNYLNNLKLESVTTTGVA